MHVFLYILKKQKGLLKGEGTYKALLLVYSTYIDDFHMLE